MVNINILKIGNVFQYIVNVFCLLKKYKEINLCKMYFLEGRNIFLKSILSCLIKCNEVIKY